MPARVAIAASPPLLADLLRRLVLRAGLEVAEGPPVDVALVTGGTALPAEVTITLMGGLADVRYRNGHRRIATAGGPSEIITLLQEVGRWQREREASPI